MTLYRYDESISYRICEATRQLRLPDGVELEHPNERNEGGNEDVNWIEDFAARGGRCVISGDEKMRDRPPERAALQAAGLVAFFPPESRFWKALGAFGQAAYLIRWFPVIVEATQNAEGAVHYRLPASWTNASVDHLIKLKHLGDEEPDQVV